MTVNVALVGVGYWGPNVARALADVEGARLHTVCDADMSRLDGCAGSTRIAGS